MSVTLIRRIKISTSFTDSRRSPTLQLIEQASPCFVGARLVGEPDLPTNRSAQSSRDGNGREACCQRDRLCSVDVPVAFSLRGGFSPVE